MNIKNQSRLPIFALVIIGTTVLSLVGLNYLVEAISKTKAPQMAQSQIPPRRMPNLNGRDDGANSPDDAAKAAPLRPMPKKMPDFNQGMPPPGMRGDPREMNGVMRNLRRPGMNGGNEAMPPIERTNGKNGNQKFPPELKERTPPPALPQIPPSERAGRPEYPTFDPNQAPQGWPPAPPPGYYPPPSDYYPEGPYYDEDYLDIPEDEGYPGYDGYDGKLEDNNKEEIKTTEVIDVDDEELNEDLYLEDEYFGDFFDENEDED